jgi:hypothetical protein
VRACATIVVAAAVVAAGPTAARADEPPPDALARAKELFKSGLALLDAGDPERALEHFERSRLLVPGKGNTVNVAVCLDRLGRFDEALEAYEEVLTRFADALAPEDRASIGPAMEALRSKVGSLEVSANVDGALVVDGHARGKLPRTTPVRVLAGSHLVRVQKDGYATCEKRVEMASGGAASVDCELAPLAAAGQLRLEDPTNPGASVFVDGALVGTTPWEGTLGPGAHLVWIEKEGRGTGPSRAFVVEGQTALVRLTSRPLGPPATIDVEPRTAELSIDDVPLGASAWRGPLPTGPRKIAASERGYVAEVIVLPEPESGGSARRLVVRLRIDPNDPRWPKRPIGAPVVGVFGGASATSSLGADAEAHCPASCGGSPTAIGFVAGARAGFCFPFGLALEIDGGYLRAETHLSRTVASSFLAAGTKRAITYRLQDDLVVRGPFFGGSASVRAPANTRVGALARATVGAFITSSSDPITGTASAGGTTSAIGVRGMNEGVFSAAPLVMPEVGVDVKVGPVSLAASLAMAFVLTPGPPFSHAAIEVSPNCTAANPGAAGCAPSSAAVAGERAYGRFYLLVPQVAATYAF